MRLSGSQLQTDSPAKSHRYSLASSLGGGQLQFPGNLGVLFYTVENLLVAVCLYSLKIRDNPQLLELTDDNCQPAVDSRSVAVEFIIQDSESNCASCEDEIGADINGPHEKHFRAFSIRDLPSDQL